MFPLLVKTCSAVLMIPVTILLVGLAVLLYKMASGNLKDGWAAFRKTHAEYTARVSGTFKRH